MQIQKYMDENSRSIHLRIILYNTFQEYCEFIIFKTYYFWTEVCLAHNSAISG